MSLGILLKIYILGQLTIIYPGHGEQYNVKKLLHPVNQIIEPLTILTKSMQSENNRTSISFTQVEKVGKVKVRNNSISTSARQSSFLQRNKRTVGLGIENEKSSSSEFKRTSSNLKTLTILGLFELSLNGTKRLNGASEKFAAELALHDINRKKILSPYKLTMLTNDTKCDAGVGVDAFFHALYSKKDIRIISLLGTACSEVTERLAKIVPYWNMVQVSFGSISPSLSDRKEFPLFYRTVSPVSSHNEAIVSFIRHFGWDRVNFFTQNENQFTMPANFLVTELEKANITCEDTITFSTDFKEQLQEMKALDSRIIIASFGIELTPMIFCEIYKLEMYGRDYAWILIGKPENLWWISPQELSKKDGTKSKNQSLTSSGNILTASIETLRSEGKRRVQHSKKLSCSYKQLQEAVQNVIFVDRHNFIGGNMKSVSGMTSTQFKEKFSYRSLPESPYAPEAYDAVWGIALGLKNLYVKYNLTLDSFEYNNTMFSKKLMEELSKLVFTGISGPISFSGADRVGVTSFLQVQGTQVEHIGVYFPRKSSLRLNCTGCSRVHWTDDQIPIARRIFRFKLIQVENTPFLIVGLLSIAGMLLAIGFLIFNLYNRKLKYIKLSSPRLNNMVIIGCIFAYGAVILLGSDFTTHPDQRDFAYICTIRAYLLSTGFSLAFGAMFAKTYRVHRIFTRSCIGVVKNKLLRDRQLMTLTMVLILIDCVIITSWNLMDPIHQHLQNLTREFDPLDRSVVYQRQIIVCYSQNGHVWLSILYGYKSLLLVVGLYMAWETRHVKIQALNDSKYIGICVYIAVLTSILAVTLAKLLYQRVTLAFLAISSLILTATTITLCLLFLPKIHALIRKDSTGDPVVESSGLKIEFNTRRFMVEDTKELLFRAEVQNRVYKRQIQAIDIEMNRIEKLLLSSSIEDVSVIDDKEKKKSKKPKLPRGRKSPTNANGEGSIKSESSGEGSESESTVSELYTVYLHRPRFIIPLSLFNFKNGTRTLEDLNTVASIAASALSSPRLSLPNTGVESEKSQRGRPRLGFQTKASKTSKSKKETHFYKSEPRLVITEPKTSDDDEPTSLGQLCLSRPVASSNESCISTLGRIETTSSTIRKDSNTSTNIRRGSVLLSVLKLPFTYMTGLLHRPRGNSAPSEEIGISTIENDLLNIGLQEPYNPKEKCCSAPDLWAVKNSPTKLSPKKRAKSSIWDSSIEQDALLQVSNNKPMNNQIPISGRDSKTRTLQLVLIGDESPYL